MDEAERLAECYLKALELGEVRFEPDGNVTPDFSVDGRIGVEVRRLNQSYQRVDGSRQGLEEVAVPFERRLARPMPTLGPSNHDESWFVCVSFERPLGPVPPLLARIGQALRGFKQSSFRCNTKLRITDRVEVDLIRASRSHEAFFVLGSANDLDAGGWVLSELSRNLRLCIAEKEVKVDRRRSSYSEWWFVLADFIDYGVAAVDRPTFLAEVVPTLNHRFSRIVLLDPRRVNPAFEF